MHTFFVSLCFLVSKIAFLCLLVPNYILNVAQQWTCLGNPAAAGVKTSHIKCAVFYDQANSRSCHTDCWTGDQIPQVAGLFFFHHCSQNNAEINPGTQGIKWPQCATDHLSASSSNVENVYRFTSAASVCLHGVVTTSSALYFSNLLLMSFMCFTDSMTWCMVWWGYITVLS